MDLTPAALRALNTSFSAAFNQAFAGVSPTWSRVAMEVPSTSRSNTYGWMKNLPGMRKWLGDRVVHSIEANAYSIVNEPFEMTIGVDRDDIEDDNLGTYAPLIAEIGLRAAEHPDEIVWPLLNAGFTTACWDGQYFFDTDHPRTDGDGNVVSVSNFGGGAGTPWYLVDMSRAVKPLVLQMRKRPQFVPMDKADDEAVFSRKEIRYGVDDRKAAGFGLWQLAYASKQTLDVDTYMTARAAMMSMKGDGDRVLGLRPTLLVVPPSLEAKARTVLTAEMVANNTNIARGTAQLHVEPRLA